MKKVYAKIVVPIQVNISFNIDDIEKFSLKDNVLLPKLSANEVDFSIDTERAEHDIMEAINSGPNFLSIDLIESFQKRS